MIEKYSINDLVDILGVTRTAVNRKIEKYNFDARHEYVNGRKLKLIELSEEQLEALKQEIGFYKEAAAESEEVVNTSVAMTNPNAAIKNVDLVNKLMEHHESVIKELRYYTDTIIENERNRVKLLQDSSRAKEVEFVQTQEENDLLKSQVNILEQKVLDLQIQLGSKSRFKAWWRSKIFNG